MKSDAGINNHKDQAAKTLTVGAVGAVVGASAVMLASEENRKKISTFIHDVYDTRDDLVKKATKKIDSIDEKIRATEKNVKKYIPKKHALKKV